LLFVCFCSASLSNLYNSTAFLFTGWMLFLPTNQQHQSTESTSNTLTYTQNRFTAVDFVQDNPGEPVLEETFTHSHLSWSSIVPYLLHPFNMIHGILPVQSTHLTVFFHNFSPSFLWSTSWLGILHFILHTFLHPIIVFFSQHMPIPSQPIFAVVPRLCHLILISLSTLYLEFYLVASCQESTSNLKLIMKCP